MWTLTPRLEPENVNETDLRKLKSSQNDPSNLEKPSLTCATLPDFLPPLAVFSIPSFPTLSHFLSLRTSPPHNPFRPLGDLSLPVDRPLNIASPPVERRRERVALQSPVQWLSTDCCGPLDSFHLISRTKSSGEWGGRQMECCGKTEGFCLWWDELPVWATLKWSWQHLRSQTIKKGQYITVLHKLNPEYNYI